MPTTGEKPVESINGVQTVLMKLIQPTEKCWCHNRIDLLSEKYKVVPYVIINP